MIVEVKGSNPIAVGGAIGEASRAVINDVILINTVVNVNKEVLKTAISSTTDQSNLINSGGVVGLLVKSNINNVTCINSRIYGGENFGFLIGSAHESRIMHTLVIGSMGIGLTKESSTGAGAGYACESSFPDIKIIKSKVMIVGKRRDILLGGSYGACIGKYCRNDPKACNLDDGVIFKGPVTVTHADAKDNYYEYMYSANKMMYKCSRSELSFISNDCIVDYTDLEAHQQIGNWQNIFSCEMSQSEAETSTSYIVAGAAGAILLSYCSYHWFAGCYKGDRGMDLIKRPITKVFYCCGCSEHSAASTDVADTEDNENDQEKSPFMIKYIFIDGYSDGETEL